MRVMTAFSRAWAGWFAMPLWLRILAALLLGGVTGFVVGPEIAAIRWVGDLFIRMIRMLIAPLVFVTLVSGMVSMQVPGRLAAIGLKAMALYLLTTLLAIGIGMGLAVILAPGVGVDFAVAPGAAVPLPDAAPLGAQLMAIVPENVFAAFADGDVLAIIFFSLLLGAGVVAAGEAGEPVGRLFVAASEVMLYVTGLVMEVAPFGVFALVAWLMGTQGPEALLNILGLAAVIYLGGLLHMLVVHAGLVRLIAHMRLGRFLAGVRTPQLLAFSTSSSAATLPASLKAAEAELGVSKSIASSVLPLGATVNMDGTALYVAAVAVFAAQAFGMPLDMADFGLIALTTVLVSVGTAAVPSASLFLLAAVLDVMGISAAQTALLIGFILPVDRILDMWRTVVNVTGDLAVATAVAASESEVRSVEIAEKT
jgi:Na+/H+-dicarboxylate symporter